MPHDQIVFHVSETKGPITLVCLIRDMGLSKCVQMVILGDLDIAKPDIKAIYILMTQCQLSASRKTFDFNLFRISPKFLIDSRSSTQA